MKQFFNYQMDGCMMKHRLKNNLEKKRVAMNMNKCSTYETDNDMRNDRKGNRCKGGPKGQGQPKRHRAAMFGWRGLFLGNKARGRYNWEVLNY